MSEFFDSLTIANATCFFAKLISITLGAGLYAILLINERKLKGAGSGSQATVLLPIYKPLLLISILILVAEDVFFAASIYWEAPMWSQIPQWAIFELGRSAYAFFLCEPSISRPALQRAIRKGAAWPLFGAICGGGVALWPHRQYEFGIAFHGAASLFHLYLFVASYFPRLPLSPRPTMRPVAMLCCLGRGLWAFDYSLVVSGMRIEDTSPVIILAGLFEIPFTMFWFLTFRSETRYWQYGELAFWPRNAHSIFFFDEDLEEEEGALTASSSSLNGTPSKTRDIRRQLSLGLLADADAELIESDLQNLIESNRNHIIHFAALRIDADAVLGVGAYSKVFRATLGRRNVAAKFFTRFLDIYPEMISAFSKETALHVALRHPNIVRCYGICVCPPAIALVTEFCDRGSLMSLLVEQRARIEALVNPSHHGPLLIDSAVASPVGSNVSSRVATRTKSSLTPNKVAQAIAVKTMSTVNPALLTSRALGSGTRPAVLTAADLPTGGLPCPKQAPTPIVFHTVVNRPAKKKTPAQRAALAAAMSGTPSLGAGSTGGSLARSSSLVAATASEPANFGAIAEGNEAAAAADKEEEGGKCVATTCEPARCTAAPAPSLASINSNTSSTADSTCTVSNGTLAGTAAADAQRLDGAPASSADAFAAAKRRGIELPDDYLWTLRRRVTMSKDAAASIAFLHAHHVMHRDIKSPNFLVAGDFTLKLTDFGLSRTVEQFIAHPELCSIYDKNSANYHKKTGHEAPLTGGLQDRLLAGSALSSDVETPSFGGGYRPPSLVSSDSDASSGRASFSTSSQSLALAASTVADSASADGGSHYGDTASVSSGSSSAGGALTPSGSSAGMMTPSASSLSSSESFAREGSSARLTRLTSSVRPSAEHAAATATNKKILKAVQSAMKGGSGGGDALVVNTTLSNSSSSASLAGSTAQPPGTPSRSASLNAIIAANDAASSAASSAMGSPRSDRTQSQRRRAAVRQVGDKFADPAKSRDTMTTAVGTFIWMAPEVQATPSYNFAADVYSLGIVLWEILSVQIPVAVDAGGVDAKDTPHWLRLPADCPTELQDLVYACTEVDPAARPTASQALLVLNHVLQSLPA